MRFIEGSKLKSLQNSGQQELCVQMDLKSTVYINLYFVKGIRGKESIIL